MSRNTDCRVSVESDSWLPVVISGASWEGSAVTAPRRLDNGAGLIALGLGAANFGLGLIKGAEQRSAANAANKARDKQAKQAFERQKKEYEISWGKELVNYSWSVAKTEAARYQDRQKKALYNQRMGWMVDGALVNLELNAEALYDKYVVEEGLRAKQEEIGFDKQMNDLLNVELVLN